MAKVLGYEIFFVTFIYCVVGSILTNDPNESVFQKIINREFRGTNKDNFKTIPSLIEDLTKLENNDFLKWYKVGEQNEDKYLNITQLCSKNGFKLQTFTVTTEDGYVITLYRIPGKGGPILLVHGVLGSAVDWMTVGRENALPYLLADREYDVWIIECRGATEQSQGHISLTLPRDAKQYWDFSWDEIGRYDLPAAIDVILKETGKFELMYVGFSQGATTFYVMGSERPEYAKKVSLMISLAPAVWLSHMKSPIFKLMTPLVAPFSEVIRNVIGYNRFNAQNPLVQFLSHYICGISGVATIVCGNIMFSLFGFDYAQVNATQLPVIFGHAPCSVSSKQLLHYAQGVSSGKFRRYDYGPEQNMVVYGSKHPPEYRVENISTPVAIFFARENDWVVDYEDVLILKRKLPNVVDFYAIPFDTFAHLDFIWAKDVKTLVYDRLLQLLEKY
ncbi:alpha/beta hydrolase fold domain-containing protein [Phthorimaea operculella]|nr:alpha/beta hydrolase fold domain-containing protein [Phthorimaea operculella]